MDSDKKRRLGRREVSLGIIILIILAGLVVWLVGRPDNKSNSTTQSQSNTSATSVKALVSYTPPDAWSEGTCSVASNTVYISPNGTTLDCSVNPSAPIKIYVDSQNTTDCQQLKPASITGIKKHVCISLYIDGHKSLKASTTYSSGSSYPTDTTISYYYINTGNGVVAYQYTYTSTNSYRAGFDQLATSTKVKS